jgi:hypothetical protein
MENCDEEQMVFVYQRLVGSMLTQNSDPPFDGAPELRELVRRSIDEGRENNTTRGFQNGRERLVDIKLA